MAGSYSGDCVVALLNDGRRVKLAAPFSYTDPQNQNWPVPADAIVDGASIPQALWSIMGGPFEGKYRAASVIHDWYCDVRTRPCKAVHRVFYDGMITSGVGQTQAKIMYYAVYKFGPQWSDTVISNTLLANSLAGLLGSVSRPDLMGFAAGVRGLLPKVKLADKPSVHQREFDEADFQAASAKIREGDLSLTELEALADD